MSGIQGWQCAIFKSEVVRRATLVAGARSLGSRLRRTEGMHASACCAALIRAGERRFAAAADLAAASNSRTSR